MLKVGGKPYKEGVEIAGMKAGAKISPRPYGSKRSPSELMKMLEPGRVAPPEGDDTEHDVGGAGLPIPEGCSSMALMDGQDGQSDTGDG